MLATIPTGLKRRVENRFLIRYNSRLFSRQPITLRPTEPTTPSNVVVHVANFSPNNAGDRLLPITVRDALGERLGFRLGEPFTRIEPFQATSCAC